MNDVLSIAFKKARRHGIPTAVLLAIIEVESGFRTNHVRFQKSNPWVYFEKVNARRAGITTETERILQHIDWGLCQITGSTARCMGYTGRLVRLLDPELNLEYGAANIAALLKQYGTPEKMAAAYRTGTAKVPYENQGYVNRFNDALRKWERDTCQPISGR